MKKFLMMAILFSFSLSFVAQEQGDKVIKGDKVPAFSFELEKGQTRSIEWYRGKVVLITFFATWCGPCRQELPHLEKEIWAVYKDRQDFVMLTFGREHNRAELEKFGKGKFSFPLYPDPKREVYGKFATQFIPRTYLIDKKGNVIFNAIGFDPQHFNEMKEMLKKALAK